MLNARLKRVEAEQQRQSELLAAVGLALTRLENQLGLAPDGQPAPPVLHVVPGAQPVARPTNLPADRRTARRA